MWVNFYSSNLNFKMICLLLVYVLSFASINHMSPTDMFMMLHVLTLLYPAAHTGVTLQVKLPDEPQTLL